jgi:formylglycine-generating enzyme required for sulfatase activity
MRKAALAGALAWLSAVACNSVLDIDEPMTRPDGTGEAGEPTSSVAGSTTGGKDGGSAGNGGTASVTEGGEGGEGAKTTVVVMTGGDSGQAGQGGEPPAVDCEAGAPRCDELAPQICDETGHWVQNTDEADGDCEFGCAADVGTCTECHEGDKRCSICPEGDNSCSPKLPQICKGGLWIDEDAPCKHFCNGGDCGKPPSCNESNSIATTCDDGLSCCTSLLVPGGEFYRDYDAVTEEHTDMTLHATISAFYLDKFEVTVARLRPFLNAYDEAKDNLLVNGAGKSTHIADDPGWKTTYILPSKTALLTSLSDCVGTTWTETGTTDDDKLPANCLPFNVAYAFCIWDGGRLPTEAEWNFAAAGGDEHRVYPWKPPLSGPEISAEFANYDGVNSGPIMVGSTPAGDGRWGHSDLAGNVSEWTLDYFAQPTPECNDCINTTTADQRVVRGGSYLHTAEGVLAAGRSSGAPDAIRSRQGFRCARDSK